MTLADIDKALAQWESRLSSAAHNLFDLQNDPTYQCITGTSDAPKTQLTGITAAKVLPPLENVGSLFRCFDLLRCTIDRAVQLRRDLPSLFGADQKLREIHQILLAKSVRIPPDQIPMSQRTLLTGADEQGCVSPDQLLFTMMRAFEAARDAVMSVDAAWNKLGASLGEAARQVAALRFRPDILEPAEMNELNGVEHSLALRRAQVQSDPLGTSLDLESVIFPVLARLKAAVEERAILAAETRDGFVNARARLENLRNLNREAADASTEAREKITGGGQLPPALPDAKLQSLGDWLDTLQQKFAAGMLRPVSIGLQNWNSAVQDCVSDLQKIHRANSAPLELRNELRGRLNALKAKAQAYGFQEDAELRALASDAEKLLFTRPTPIDRAIDVVTRYGALLNQRTTDTKTRG